QFSFAAVAITVSVSQATSAVGTANQGAPVDFASQVQPILSKKCFACHGPDERSRKGKLRLDSFAEATRARDPRPAILPGNAEKSELLHRIRETDPEEVMPPPELKNPLTPAEIEILERWIIGGADYAPHWAWIAPKRPALPEIADPGWPKTGLDYFIAAKLAENGLKPSAPADRYTLIRRLSLALTGLPPEPEDVEAFVADTRPGAYERVVDQLLASPHFGERWSRVWLDLGRYADSAGYGSDPLRPNIWPWRDWLIQALNANEPFDEFTRDLIAGDLVPDATDEQRIASAFHRNTMTNTEGGTDDEEWRVAAVKDRAGVTAQVWMGLTMNCAQCHTHKFDPITQKEYYSFFAFFNETEDNDQPDERPTLPVYSLQERKQRAALELEVGQAEKEYRAPNAEYESELAAWATRAAEPIPWTALVPQSVTAGSTNPPTFTIDSAGSVLVSGPAADRDSYLITVTAPIARLTALAIEALTDSTLPQGGPGRATSGAFVLNDVRVELVPSGREARSARFVRLEAPGANRILSLAEVQVFSAGTNIALKGSPTQSSTDYLGDANRAVDGNTDGNYGEARSTSHTRSENDPWWELDLGAEFPVEQIAVWNRTDGGVGTRLANSKIRLLDGRRETVWQLVLTNAPDPVVKVGPAAPQALALVNASADHSQSDFAAAEAIDKDTSRMSGWAVGGELGRPHRWAAEFAEALDLSAPATLRISLAHNYGEHQTLGKFRISVTDRATPVRIFPGPVQAALAVAPSQWTPTHRSILDDYFRPQSATLGPKFKELAALRAKRDAVRGTAVPVMRQLGPDSQRITRVLNKGNFLDPGDPVTAGVPVAFNPWPTEAPTNRLGLARWLTAPDNPLTSRVAVNRVWAQLMGQALVETEEDFGTQGALPTNRPLLDWLAVSFQSPKPTPDRTDLLEPKLGWDLKALIKLIVMSAVYQQSSAVTPELREKDPLNKLYSRAPRLRLDAETVRDQALMLSGLLSRKIGGPSVYPMQPDGLWRAAFNGERSWATSEGEDRYRRGIYTFWRRTVPYPSMATFDAPSRETCTLRRQPTNTPLQAFVTLNDPVFVECAQALGRRLASEPGPVAERIRNGLQRVLSRPATTQQVEALVQLFESEVANYRERVDEAVKLASDPLGPLPADLPPAEAAAWTTVANVLLNLDGVLVKN
ncbi:MAG TPA: hypothetical protein DCE44_10755, partial [Verrucomicrobiales bacterium]|nr:hypothetical protein [Verrucomicrobiales bacterium]